MGHISRSHTSSPPTSSPSYNEDGDDYSYNNNNNNYNSYDDDDYSYYNNYYNSYGDFFLILNTVIVGCCVFLILCWFMIYCSSFSSLHKAIKNIEEEHRRIFNENNNVKKEDEDVEDENEDSNNENVNTHDSNGTSQDNATVNTATKGDASVFSIETLKSKISFLNAPTHLSMTEEDNTEKDINNSEANASDKDTEATFSLESFDSITFKHMVIPTYLEKAIFFLKCFQKLLKSISDYLCEPFSSLLNLVMFILCLPLWILNTIFTILAKPLMILLEAKGNDGKIHRFMIADKRPWPPRYFDIGEIMTLTSIDGNKEKVVMRGIGNQRSTFRTYSRVFSSLTSVDTFKEDPDDTVIYKDAAKIKMEFSPCGCPTKCGEVELQRVEVNSTKKKMMFKYQKDCIPHNIKIDRVNRVVLPKNGWSQDDYKLMVKFVKPSCQDLMMELEELITDMEMEVDLEMEVDTEMEVEMKMEVDAEMGVNVKVKEELVEETCQTIKDAKEHVDAVKDIAKEVKETANAYKKMATKEKSILAQLKEDGYRTVRTSSSVWAIDFTSMPFNHDEKAAAIYFIYDMMMMHHRERYYKKVR